MSFSRFLHLSFWISIFFTTTSVSAYFLIDEPYRDVQWVNGQANLVKWQKGLLDGVNGFDVEMAQLSTDGLTFIARNVPAQQETLNVFIQDIPPGDDYFLIFMNSTHGVMHATSPRFSVLSAGANPTNKGDSPNNAVPTVTVSGAPNPTKAFATTFPALPYSGAVGGWTSAVPGATHLTLLVSVTLALVAMGGAWTMS